MRPLGAYRAHLTYDKLITDNLISGNDVKP